MNLILPEKNIEHFPTDKLIKSSVDYLYENPGKFLILEKSEMTYVQVLRVDHGFIMQFQQDSIRDHYEFVQYLSRPSVIRLLKNYVALKEDWFENFEYKKVNVQGFLGSLGYISGFIYTKVMKALWANK